MPESIPADSVGLVTPETITFDDPLTLACGRTLKGYQLKVETYGNLNTKKTNAVLICHALSGHHHAAGYHSMSDRKPGWWDNYIGPGKPIDTNELFVVSLNNIGGCHGSTGPTSFNPETGKPFGPDFPVVTVTDWVNTQAALANYFAIEQWAAVIGGSLGGMQALQWSMTYPERLRYALIIASAPKLSAQNIAFNEVARQAIMKDEDFYGGRYLENSTYPKSGLMLARMVGHITYLSDAAMRSKFGRDLRSGHLNFNYEVDFQVESYLRYQGEVFSEGFDANSYLLMTKALDYFDPAAEFDGDLTTALEQTQCKFLLISFTTDWRFSPERSKEIVDALLNAKKDVSYLEVDAPEGHDAFLLPIARYKQAFYAYMNRIIREVA
ncbi:homoserine O-succinyltransferase MetX [Zooshikella harenae]|uniref:Homoserine O-succinyltransferase n=1 Tax=Zooshikella harenae TaxID=2827238 RepID=A0ABS5Z645_9GAMM|nr:homoserine O-acetyltransferase [Zooshikella harenae]MBU2709519.1 homoserine O-acetyltransferase [Zooshikella harenae]